MASSWAGDAGIALDHRADVPLGVQLDWALRAAVAAGRLRPGERLPALRELADALGVNHNTLRAAVAKLESDGLLESRHGTGTFVAENAIAHEHHVPLVAEATRLAADAGVTPRELAAALYVAGDAPAGDREAAAAERRTLRDEIAMLDRVVARLEAQLPDPLPAQPRAPRPKGAGVLSADELRAERDALLRRLALVQGELDDLAAHDAPAEAPAPAPQRAPAKKPRLGHLPAT
jgi:DNA-binding FadR family transcriptional regulator